MIINYFCWSTFISLVAILLLYPLRQHVHGAWVTRATSAGFVLPSLISAIVAQIYVMRHDLILISVTRTTILKMQFGFQITEANAPIIVAINVLMAILIFALSNRNLVTYCSIASLAGLFIFIIVATPDQLVRIGALSIGTIALTSLLIADEVDTPIMAVLSQDFIINRLSDFFAFTAIIHMLLRFGSFITNDIDMAANDIEFIHNFLFLMSIALRIFSLCRTNGYRPGASGTALKLLVFYRLLLGVGAELLLLFYSSPPQAGTTQFTIFLVVTTALLAYALSNAFTNFEKPYSINNVVNIIFVTNLYFILRDYKVLATGVICFLIIAYPTTSLAFSRRGIERLAQSERLAIYERLERIVTIITRPITRFAVLLSTMFINGVNVIYAGVVLYRLPQIMLATVQMPLRFLSNGSIQRSLIFVMIMLAAYSYWWREI